MKIRAKFTVGKVAELGNWNGGRQEITKPAANNPNRYESTGVPVREITMHAVYENSADPESKSFADATPTGTLTFVLSNAVLAEEFKPGDAYYLDMVRVEPTPKAS